MKWTARNLGFFILPMHTKHLPALASLTLAALIAGSWSMQGESWLSAQWIGPPVRVPTDSGIPPSTQGEPSSTVPSAQKPQSGTPAPPAESKDPCAKSNNGGGESVGGTNSTDGGSSGNQGTKGGSDSNGEDSGSGNSGNESDDGGSSGSGGGNETSSCLETNIEGISHTDGARYVLFTENQHYNDNTNAQRFHLLDREARKAVFVGDGRDPVMSADGSIVAYAAANGQGPGQDDMRGVRLLGIWYRETGTTTTVDLVKLMQNRWTEMQQNSINIPQIHSIHPLLSGDNRSIVVFYPLDNFGRSFAQLVVDTQNTDNISVVQAQVTNDMTEFIPLTHSHFVYRSPDGRIGPLIDMQHVFVSSNGRTGAYTYFQGIATIWDAIANLIGPNVYAYFTESAVLAKLPTVIVGPVSGDGARVAYYTSDGKIYDRDLDRSFDLSEGCFPSDLDWPGNIVVCNRDYADTDAAKAKARHDALYDVSTGSSEDVSINGKGEQCDTGE